MSNIAQDSLNDLHSDEFTFAPEDEAEIVTTSQNQPEQSWKILIVDDDIEVHEVTKLALSDFIFENKPLTFISAYSGQEAKQIIQTHPNIAIIFLDVVMETEDAGLQIIQYIREELGNSLVRIILRTGQPGQAPETVVAANYGIDDYKTKTELTSNKLFISVVTALRVFSTLMQMRELSQGLKLELTKYQQVEADLQHSGKQREKAGVLSQAVTATTQEILHTPNTDTLHTMAILTRIARMVLRITDEHSAKLGLSQSKLAVLMYLNSKPQLGASPSFLAKHCGVSRAAMTGLLDGLEQEEYVERDDHPSDRRALMVKLTQKGQQFLDGIETQDQYQSIKLIDMLDEVERQKFIEFAREVLKLFEDRLQTTSVVGEEISGEALSVSIKSSPITDLSLRKKQK
ncbi:MarR family transcriptional regulator [Phormidium sp. CLA17]|uniref:MarR family transcriptional regulator n=1 Tax=Leptolyngbya sp. Cla-17 TaxID=2803751 RepID=UPI001492DD01|nr:MarR family transcriptional regulator [Leptolyngbya sp. Cla-17]MBM0744022.1 MarR family transcriptional regulator [Leptolyngbya sp. Cla-17]